MAEAMDLVPESRSAWKRIYNASVITAAGGFLIFEQSPANETIRIDAGLDVLKSTGSAIDVGLTIFAITALIEGVSSVPIIAGLHSEGGGVQKLKAKMQKREGEGGETSVEVVAESKPSALGKVASSGTDVGIALGLGAGLVAVKRHVADPNPTLAKDIKNSAKATGVVSAVSGSIGYLASGGIANLEKVGLETPGQYIIDYGTDTKFWMGALLIGYGGYYAKKGINKMRNRNDKNDGVDEHDTFNDLQQHANNLVTE